jgi:hypothetical protein
MRHCRINHVRVSSGAKQKSGPINYEGRMAMSVWTIIVLGCAGGILPDVLRIIKERNSEELPVYLRRSVFWIGLVLLVAVGGLAAWLLGAQDAKQAVAYGFAAPELLSRLGAKAQEDSGREDRSDRIQGARYTLRSWWVI